MTRNARRLALFLAVFTASCAARQTRDEHGNLRCRDDADCSSLRGGRCVVTGDGRRCANGDPSRTVTPPVTRRAPLRPVEKAIDDPLCPPGQRQCWHGNGTRYCAAVCDRLRP